MRRNYQPFVSEETKILITERRNLQQRAISSGCRVLKKEFNRKNKEVKRRMKEDKMNYFEEKFKECDSKNVWRTANELLGSVKNLSPTNILHKVVADCDAKMVNNPERIASIFNEFFVQIPAKRRRGHSLTACNAAPPATPARPLYPKWRMGSGNRSNLRLLDPPINFR